MITQDNKKQAKELIDYIIKSNVNGDWDDTFDSLVEEYRKDFSQLTLAKIICYSLIGEMYIPYKQDFIKGKMFWGMERFEINGKQVRFVYNDTDKITKKEAMRFSWFSSSGKTVISDRYFLENSEFIVINKDNDFIELYVANVLKISDIIKKLEENEGEYDEQDIDTLAYILSEEKLFGDYKRYVDEETGKEYYGFPFLPSNKKGYLIDFVDKKSGIVSFTDDEYRRLKKL